MIYSSPVALLVDRPRGPFPPAEGAVMLRRDRTLVRGRGPGRPRSVGLGGWRGGWYQRTEPTMERSTRGDGPLVQDRSLGREIDGLLGMSFLSRFSLSIAKREWKLSPKS